MARLLLFHHVQGLTPGVRAFADRLRAGGHEVTTPDLFGGRTFASIEEGMEYGDAHQDKAVQMAKAAAAVLGPGFAVGGISYGVVPAQTLAQQHDGVRAAVLIDGGLKTEWFGGAWRPGVALQIHICADDPWAERPMPDDLAAEAGGELNLYPGAAHLSVDASLPSYDETITAQVVERTIAFLDALG